MHFDYTVEEGLRVRGMRGRNFPRDKGGRENEGKVKGGREFNGKKGGKGSKKGQYRINEIE